MSTKPVGIQRIVATLLPIVLLLLVFLLVPHETYAQFNDPLGQNTTLYDFLVTIIEAVIIILFPILVLMIVYTGFLFVTAQGNPQKIEAAKRALIWTVIGALLVLGVMALVEVIEATVDQLTP